VSAAGSTPGLPSCLPGCPVHGPSLFVCGALRRDSRSSSRGAARPSSAITRSAQGFPKPGAFIEFEKAAVQRNLVGGRRTCFSDQVFKPRASLQFRWGLGALTISYRGGYPVWQETWASTHDEGKKLAAFEGPCIGQELSVLPRVSFHRLRCLGRTALKKIRRTVFSGRSVRCGPIEVRYSPPDESGPSGWLPPRAGMINTAFLPPADLWRLPRTSVVGARVCSARRRPLPLRGWAFLGARWSLLGWGRFVGLVRMGHRNVGKGPSGLAGGDARKTQSHASRNPDMMRVPWQTERPVRRRAGRRLRSQKP